MSRILLALLLGIALVACSGSTADDAGTTGGETATSPLEPEIARDEAGSLAGGGGGMDDDQGPTPSCDGVECEPGQSCALVEVQCIRAPCPPQPMCVDSSATCATMLCRSGTRCVQSTSGARCVEAQ